VVITPTWKYFMKKINFILGWVEVSSLSVVGHSRTKKILCRKESRGFSLLLRRKNHPSWKFSWRRLYIFWDNQLNLPFCSHEGSDHRKAKMTSTHGNINLFHENFHEGWFSLRSRSEGSLVTPFNIKSSAWKFSWRMIDPRRGKVLSTSTKTKLIFLMKIFHERWLTPEGEKLLSTSPKIKLSRKFPSRIILPPK
jgi:hypothetical protein